MAKQAKKDTEKTVAKAEETESKSKDEAKKESEAEKQAEETDEKADGKTAAEGTLKLKRISHDKVLVQTVPQKASGLDKKIEKEKAKADLEKKGEEAGASMVDDKKKEA